MARHKGTKIEETRHKLTNAKETGYLCKKCGCKRYDYPFKDSMYIHMYATTFRAPECMTTTKRVAQCSND